MQRQYITLRRKKINPISAIGRNSLTFKPHVILQNSKFILYFPFSILIRVRDSHRFGAVAEEKHKRERREREMLEERDIANVEI